MRIKKVRSVCKTEARKAVKGHEKAMHGVKKMLVVLSVGYEKIRSGHG
jgi:hypothetical protein